MGRNDPNKDLGICTILGSPQRHNSKKDGENERKTEMSTLESSRIGRGMMATQKSARWTVHQVRGQNRPSDSHCRQMHTTHALSLEA